MNPAFVLPAICTALLSCLQSAFFLIFMGNEDDLLQPDMRAMLYG